MIALGLVLAAAVPPGDTPPPASEIVVTAPGGGDSVAVRDMPVDAHALAGDALVQRHASNLADLLDGALGSVSLSNGSGSPYQNDLAIRGFQATSLLGAPTGLSVWLDGVRLNEPFGAIVNWDLIPLNALRRVEIDPGANPVFGLNTLGGALVLTPKGAADSPGLSLSAQGGSFARAGGQGEAGGTLRGGAFDWFVAGTYDEQDGYRRYTHNRVTQGYGALGWHGAGANAQASVLWADSALNGTQGLPLSMLGMPALAYTRPDSVANAALVVNLKGDARLAASLRLSGNAYYRRSSAHATNSNASLGDACGLAYACSALAPGGTALDLAANNPYGGGTYQGALPLHDYTGAINTALVRSGLAQHTWGGNVLLDWDKTTGPITHDANLGGSVEISRIGYDQNSDLAYLVNYQTVPQPWNFRYASSTGFRGNPQISGVAVTSRNSALDLFVRDMIQLTPRFSLSAALTWEHTRVSLGGTKTTYLDPGGAYAFTGNDGTIRVNPAYLGAQYFDEATGTLATATLPPGAEPGPEIDPLRGSHGYSRINPAIGLVWNTRPNLGFFASYSEAMRAPTAVELACANPATPCALPTGFNGDPALRAVVAHAFEAGARGAIGKAVTWNAAIYRTRVANDIQFITSAAGLGYFANVGETERKGLEAGLTADWRVIQLSLSYGYVAATYRSSFIDARGDTVRPGAQITGIPRSSFKARGSLHPSRSLTLAANLIAVSRQYAHGDEANTGLAVPGYALIGADAEWNPAPRVGLFATITNLAGVHYATYGVWGGNIYNGQTEQFRTPAPGRAVLAGLRYSFGRGARAGDAPGR